MKLRSFKSSEWINEKKDGPYRGFGYPLALAEWSQSEILQFALFNGMVGVPQTTVLPLI